jgi:predicted AAA+ superfamily ATPase
LPPICRPISSAIFEGFIASEILKSQINRGQRKELYYFRDQQGLEIDFLLPQPNARFWLIEAKSSKTVQPSMAAPMLSLSKAAGDRASRRIVVYRKSRNQPAFTALAKGAEALTVEQFVEAINPAKLGSKSK